MSGSDLDRHVYLPIWHMLRHLLIVHSLMHPREPGRRSSCGRSRRGDRPHDGHLRAAYEGDER